MKWKNMKINNILVENPKSKIKVEESGDGIYPFFTSGENVLKTNKHLVDGENLFMSTGGFASIKYFNGKASYSTDTYSLKTKCNTLWLYYLILSKINKINKVMFQGSGLKHLNKNMFKDMDILLPTNKEQQKIAEILSTVDEAIEKVNDKIKTTERIKRGLMDELLTKGIGHTEFKKTELGRIPNSWKIISLNDSSNFELIMGQSPPSKYYNREKKGMLFLQGNSEFGKFSPNSTIYCSKQMKISKKGDILISVRAPVGEINYSDQNYCLGRGIGAIRSNNSNDSKFLFYLFQSLQNKIKGLGAGSTFTAITKNTLEKIKIALPVDIKEQQKIAEILSNVDELIESQKTEKDRLERVKQGLMDDLLTGKVRVKV